MFLNIHGHISPFFTPAVSSSFRQSCRVDCHLRSPSFEAAFCQHGVPLLRALYLFVVKGVVLACLIPRVHSCKNRGCGGKAAQTLK